MTHYLLLALICVARTPAWNEIQFGEKTILLQPMPDQVPRGLSRHGSHGDKGRFFRGGRLSRTG